MDAHPLLKKNLRPIFSSSFSDVFVGNSVTPISTLANNKRSCSKKWKIPGQNCDFFCLFFRGNFGTIFIFDFVMPFSTFANIQGPLPTNSTTPDRLRCRSKTDGEEFPGFWPIHFSNIVQGTSWPPQEKLFIWSLFVTRLLTPRSRKSGYGLLLGCRSSLDAGPFEKTFF